MVSQKFPCCISLGGQMWKYLEWLCKGPGACPLMLPLFLVVDLDLSLNLGDLKKELKFLVDYLFCNLIAWLSYTEIDNA